MNLINLLYKIHRDRLSGCYNLFDLNTGDLGYIQFSRGEINGCVLGKLTAVTALSRAYALDRDFHLKLMNSSKENISIVNISLSFGHLLARIFENFLHYKKLKKNFDFQLNHEIKKDNSFYYIKEINNENSETQSR